MNYLFAACGSIIFLFILNILKKPKKSKADFLLILVNLCIALFLVSEVIISMQLSSGAIILQNLLPLILFPAFTFYLLEFTHAKKQISKGWYILFLPALGLIVLSTLDHYILQSYPNQSALENHYNKPAWYYQIIFKGSQLTFIAALIYLLGELKRFEKDLKEGYSTLETIEVRWLMHFTWIYLGSICLTFLLFLSQNLGWLPFAIDQVFGIVYGVLVLAVFYLNYQGIHHYTLSQLGSNKEENQPQKLNLVGEKDALKKELSEKEISLELEILNAVEQKQLYLNPTISLDDLANHLQKSKHQISKILNAREGRSFYDLINQYRVKHLQNLMEESTNANYTILALGLESGFNSKASMNRIFKNNTGLSPKQYLESRKTKEKTA